MRTGRPRIMLKLAQMQGLSEKEFLELQLSHPGPMKYRERGIPIPLYVHAERIGVDVHTLRKSMKICEINYK